MVACVIGRLSVTCLIGWAFGTITVAPTLARWVYDGLLYGRWMYGLLFGPWVYCVLHGPVDCVPPYQKGESSIGVKLFLVL